LVKRLPQPPSTNQNVPMNSAASFFESGIVDSRLLAFLPGPQKYQIRG
jgi:hypothetical protein